ncbi:MAG: hypothetical protein QOH63_1939 [Acidobacteriota bacterium]|jgi:hypothetical protein|nr:hypothetical protein [Acidobacteriota bacterium]
MEQPKHYLIKTVEDFFQVPADRVERCLKEFGIMLYTARFVKDIAAEVATTDAVKVRVFEWIDDDKLKVTIRLGTEERLASVGSGDSTANESLVI